MSTNENTIVGRVYVDGDALATLRALARLSVADRAQAAMQPSPAASALPPPADHFDEFGLQELWEAVRTHDLLGPGYQGTPHAYPLDARACRHLRDAIRWIDGELEDASEPGENPERLEDARRDARVADLARAVLGRVETTIRERSA